MVYLEEKTFDFYYNTRLKGRISGMCVDFSLIHSTSLNDARLDSGVVKHRDALEWFVNTILAFSRLVAFNFNFHSNNEATAHAN